MALIPPLLPVRAVELPPPNVKPIAAVELPPPNIKPVAVLELKAVAAVEAPYGTETAKPIQVAANEYTSNAVLPPPESPALEYTPVAHPKGASAADYNPQMY